MNQPSDDVEVSAEVVEGDTDLITVRRIIERARRFGLGDVRKLADLLNREGFTTVGGREWTPSRLLPYLRRRSSSGAGDA